MNEKLYTLVKENISDAPTDLTPSMGIGSSPNWDSMSHFNLLLAVEDEFQVRFEVEEIPELKTIALISSALINKGCKP